MGERSPTASQLEERLSRALVSLPVRQLEVPDFSRTAVAASRVTLMAWAIGLAGAAPITPAWTGARLRATRDSSSPWILLEREEGKTIGLEIRQ
jgi:hypothetical protein